METILTEDFNNFHLLLSCFCYNKTDVEIIEARAMSDHIHMLMSIPPNEKVSSFIEYLKGKSTMIIFEQYAKLKYKYGYRHFWSRGYYISTVVVTSKPYIGIYRIKRKKI